MSIHGVCVDYPQGWLDKNRILYGYAILSTNLRIIILNAYALFVRTRVRIYRAPISKAEDWDLRQRRGSSFICRIRPRDARRNMSI
jgi:hypothetical protein